MFAVVREAVSEHLVEEEVLLGDGGVLALVAVERAGGGRRPSPRTAARAAAPATVPLHFDGCEIHADARSPLERRPLTKIGLS